MGTSDDGIAETQATAPPPDARALDHNRPRHWTTVRAGQPPLIRWALLVTAVGCAAASDPDRCTYTLPATPSFQTTPVIAGRTLIVTTASHTRAIDAVSCQERWRWDHWNEGKGWPSNRGGVVSDSIFLRGTPDGHLVALDVRSGRVAWIQPIADPVVGETLTMQPAVFDSLVFIGTAGSEDAVQGWVGAYRLRDGARVWRFSTIDSSTWLATPNVKYGGASVWTRFSVDSVTGTLYAATTNPAPDFAPELRPGLNLYTNSVVALDARTGRLRWYRQLIRGDEDGRDWDLTQAGPIVGDALIAGGKDGIVRGISRRDGSVLWSTPVSKQSNTRAPITAAGTHVCPGVFGGLMWSQPTYSARSGLVYVPSVDWCATIYRDTVMRNKPGEAHLGGHFIADRERAGVLTALDPRTGAIRWRYHSTQPMLASVVSFGDTVVIGELTGDLVGLDGRTGRQLFRRGLGSQVGAGLMTYVLDGRRYLAVPSGSLSAMLPNAHVGEPTVTVLRLP